MIGRAGERKSIQDDATAPKDLPPSPGALLALEI